LHSGLFAFATTALTLSFYNVGTRGVGNGDLIVGMALFTGGLAQFIAGMWDFPRGDMFGASGKFVPLVAVQLLSRGLINVPSTAFACYGAFWMSYAVLLIPGSGVAAAYQDTPQQFDDAVGIFLTCWFIVTVLFWFVSCYFVGMLNLKCFRLPRIASLRKCIAFVVTFGFLAMTFMVLAAAKFTGNAEYVPIHLLLFSVPVP
jgi:succinate-acetate transporter protein